MNPNAYSRQVIGRSNHVDAKIAPKEEIPTGREIARQALRTAGLIRGKRTEKTQLTEQEGEQGETPPPGFLNVPEYEDTVEKSIRILRKILTQLQGPRAPVKSISHRVREVLDLLEGGGNDDEVGGYHP